MCKSSISGNADIAIWTYSLFIYMCYVLSFPFHQRFNSFIDFHFLIVWYFSFPGFTSRFWNKVARLWISVLCKDVTMKLVQQIKSLKFSIFHPKVLLIWIFPFKIMLIYWIIEICWKLNHPYTIQDVDEFVSSSEQIWRNLALRHLLTNGSSAVNGCRQNESPNSC